MKTFLLPISTVFLLIYYNGYTQNPFPMDFNDREVSIVSGRLTYDGLGRVKATYLPITEELSQKEIINDGFDTSVEPSRTEFDVLDRPIMIVEPLAVP